MGISSRDTAPFSQISSKLSELAGPEEMGYDKTFTWSERARIHLCLIEEAEKGLSDVTAGRTSDAKAALQKIKGRRAVET